MADSSRTSDYIPGLPDPFRRLVESVRDYGIFLLDTTGHVLTWNLGAEHLKGSKAPEIIGRHFSVFYPEEARRRKWPEQELAMAGEKGRFEDEGPRVRKDGSTFWANVVLSPVFGAEGELKGYAKVTRDLTDQKRVEALEKAEKQTNEFLAMLAHELRNPLAPIRNALQLLAKKPTADPAEIWVREVLQRQTVQMTRLVDDLLDASRGTRSTVSLSKMRLDLHKLVRDAVDAATQWVQMRHHHLTVSLPDDKLEIEADPVRLNQVIQNLLHNAAKFTPNGGKIQIAAAREGDRAVIRVKDNGIGMTPQLLKSAFELFKQGQQGIDRPEGGLGVGLTLAERLVALHGGSVEARSEGLGHGSEFIVRLPMQHGALAPPAKEAEDESVPPVPRRPLVGHDNPDAPKPPRLRPG